MLTPSLPELRIVQSRLAPASWERRVEAAQFSAASLDPVLAEIEAGSSLNKAIELKLPASRRSWALRSLPRLRAYGVEGLIDRRLPREPSMTEDVRIAIEAAYRSDPGVTADVAVDQLVGKGLTCLPSRDRIDRELAAVRACSQPKPAQLKPVVEEKRVEEEVELPFAGGELLLAAEIETGAVAALTQEVVELGREAREVSVGREPECDRADRDDKGRFTAQYTRSVSVGKERRLRRISGRRRKRPRVESRPGRGSCTSESPRFTRR